MSNKVDHIRHLYQKYLDHTATEAEYDRLFDYLHNPENLELLKEELNATWRSGDHNNGFSPLQWDDIEKEVLKRRARERKFRLERNNRRYRWAAAAAILLIVGLSVGMYLSYGGFRDYITYETGYGEVEKIVLDDGSRITLNANSVLKWKKDWEDGNRIAILEGEAYFDVQTILDKATGVKTGFDVQTDDLTIQVVGTSFNVKSRVTRTDVYLDEGKIQLDLKTQVTSPGADDITTDLVLHPGESVSYSAETQVLDRAESDQYGNASWMEGTFLFSGVSVSEILESLEQIYGVKFKVQDQEILNRKLTTGLPYSDWPIVESALELLLKAQLEEKDGLIMIHQRE